MSKTYPSKQITWIYPEDNSPIGVGEGMVPEVSNFLANLGITHKDVIKHCNGSLKLGIKFDGFNQEGETFLFPFGMSDENQIYNTSLTKRIIETSKIPNNILEYPDISFHIRATEILSYMDTLAPSIPNLTIQREMVSLDKIAGTYDLLIDSTGFGRHVSKLTDNFISLSDRLPNNRALAYRHNYTDLETQCLPYSIFTAMDYGWTWHIPLGDHLALGYVHDGKYAESVKVEFINHIKQKLGIDPDPSQIREVSMITGRNKIHLKDNVVAVGLASGFIEPLESTGLYLTIASVRKLCDYIDGDLSEQEYNDIVNEDFDTVVDFVIAHYKYSKRDNEYWNFCKDIPIKVKEMDLFPIESWQFILAGFHKNFNSPEFPMDPRELINIHRGTPYYEWINDEKNFT